MEKKKRLAGRFLPSRVYARWKWTVRLGLSALPLVLFLSGGVALYFTPSRYQSGVVFEYLGERDPSEAAALLRTRSVIDPAATALKLVGLMEIDSETLAEWISTNMDAEVEPGTGLITLRVTNTRKEVARDLAAELVRSLDAYEKAIMVEENEALADAEGRSARDAEDHAEEKRKDLTRVMRLRDGGIPDAFSQLEIDALRGEWEMARQKVAGHWDRHAEAMRNVANPGKWVSVHSQPVISNTPLKPEISLEDVILHAVAIGLGFTLAAPYLLELAFPRLYRPRGVENSVWSDAEAEPEMTELRA